MRKTSFLACAVLLAIAAACAVVQAKDSVLITVIVRDVTGAVGIVVD